jgi:hypothetical protein
MTWATSNLVRQSLYKLDHFLIKSQIKPCTAFLWEVGYAALLYTVSLDIENHFNTVINKSVK